MYQEYVYGYPDKGDNDDIIIIIATGTISKAPRQYLSNIPGKHEIKELQISAILGTAHVLRKVLM